MIAAACTVKMIPWPIVGVALFSLPAMIIPAIAAQTCNHVDYNYCSIDVYSIISSDFFICTNCIHISTKLSIFGMEIRK